MRTIRVPRRRRLLRHLMMSGMAFAAHRHGPFPGAGGIGMARQHTGTSLARPENEGEEGQKCCL